MENIVIQGYRKEYFIPSVNFNVETGICQLSGESYLEDTIEFYNPILDWLEEFMETTRRPITLVIKLTYFNTSSSRRILDILNLLKDYEDEGGVVYINWFYHDYDIDMLEDVEDYEIDTGLNINLIPFDSKDETFV
jgi:hypothetical protein